MREIKFRGLDATGEMVFGLITKDLKNSTAYYSDYSYRIHWHPESGGQSNCPVKNGTLGQYTGLKDVNGVEIYEGDIVRWEWRGDEIIESVYFNETVSAFETETSCLDSESFAIIGNIHQNPELLK